MRSDDVSSRPIDRFIKWGDGSWGMVIGEPDTMLGSPMEMIGPPDNWQDILGEQPLTEGTDDDIFEEVKKARKERLR